MFFFGWKEYDRRVSCTSRSCNTKNINASGECNQETNTWTDSLQISKWDWISQINRTYSGRPLWSLVASGVLQIKRKTKGHKKKSNWEPHGRALWRKPLQEDKGHAYMFIRKKKRNNTCKGPNRRALLGSFGFCSSVCACHGLGVRAVMWR